MRLILQNWVGDNEIEVIEDIQDYDLSNPNTQAEVVRRAHPAIEQMTLAEKQESESLVQEEMEAEANVAVAAAVGKLLPGRVSLFRGKVRKPVSITLTPVHHAMVKAAMKRLGLSRSDVIGLLIDKHAAIVRVE